MLQQLELDPGFYNRYPHEFSGGQRQRISIARALILKPSFVVFDESVSALDVSVQAQVLNIITRLKDEMNFSGIFISHDLSVVHYICDRILIMQKGRIVESGSANQIFKQPREAYTKALMDAIPGKKLFA
jgi:peptide/nickel transport system ATP-binding protein